jgi:serine/threonine-protein kinase
MVTVMKTEAIRGDWAGQVIDGKFILQQWLGGSDISGVFLTEAPGDQPQKAAIRLIPAGTKDADAQLARWQAVASLTHTHLMRLLHCGRCQVAGNPMIYAVTEYAEENLAEVLPHRPLTVTETREMLDPVLDALAYLHGKGFVHGHVKPSNIMVVNDRVKLTSDNIQAAGGIGKPVPAFGAHDAPECAIGTISPAADVWSLGVTLVEALTQRLPVQDRAAQNDPVVPESMPEPFAGIARESLRTDPAQRCSLGDIKARLDGASAQARPASESGKAAPSKLRVPVIAVSVLAVLALFAIFHTRSHEEPSPQSTAEVQSEPATSKPSPEVKSEPATPTPAAETPSEPAVQPPAAQAPPAEVKGEPATPAPSAERHSEPATPVPAAPSPSPERRASGGAAVKGEVAERAQPDLLPKAVSSIHGKFEVKVRLSVDAAGAVSTAEIESQGPSKYFANAALEAARHWKFKPAQVNGQAAVSTWVLQFRFKRDGTEITPVEVAP